MRNFEMGNLILNYSFMKNEISQHEEEIIGKINNTNKVILYTHGLGYRNPTTYKVPIEKEKAIELIKKESLVDFMEYTNCLYINTFSGNDLW